MRITSGGNIEQGTVGTTASAYYYFNATTTGDTGIIFRDNASTNSGFLTYNHDQDAMKFATAGSERMRITSGGALEIKGTSTDTYSQAFITNDNNITTFGSSVSGLVTKPLSFHTGAERMRITSSGTIFMYGLGGYTSSNADVRYATSSSELYYQTSSKRYKTNIVNLENSLDKINKLRPVRYVDINTEEPACGLIAEETVELIPEVVFTKEIEGFDEPQVEGINYSDIVPFLIKSIQELKAEVDKLKQECKCKN